MNMFDLASETLLQLISIFPVFFTLTWVLNLVADLLWRKD